MFRGSLARTDAISIGAWIFAMRTGTEILPLPCMRSRIRPSSENEKRNETGAENPGHPHGACQQPACVKCDLLPPLACCSYINSSSVAVNFSHIVPSSRTLRLGGIRRMNSIERQDTIEFLDSYLSDGIMEAPTLSSKQIKHARVCNVCFVFFLKK